MEEGLGKRKKGGRPKLVETKAATVGIRLSEKERQVIQQKARAAGLRLTAYIRQVSLAGTVKPRLSEEDRFLVRQLVGYSNNINQVAKTCHEKGIFTALGYFEKMRTQIEQIIVKLAR